MSRFKINKRAKVNIKTKKSSAVKKTYKRLDRGLSREGKIKIKKLIDSLREGSTKLDSLEDLIKKSFGNLSKTEIDVISIYIFENYINKLEEELDSTGDDDQLANIDLQNALQKQHRFGLCTTGCERRSIDATFSGAASPRQAAPSLARSRRASRAHTHHLAAPCRRLKRRRTALTARLAT